MDLKRIDTICALATASAPAAIAVVRVSGREAFDVCARVFRARRGKQRDFVATLGDVVEGDVVVDEALCTRFPEGKSYTGEASFELSLHGSPVTVRAVLRVLVQAGCRLAEPGELTMRAVLTGRMDLVAAEAVDDVIHAKTEAASRAALRTLRGGLAAKIDPVREVIIDALAEIEARLDFPDEDLGDARLDELCGTLDDARGTAAELVASSRYGRLLQEGARVVLYGPPNAGKSTLLNALIGAERALVHEEPGTTRDVLEVPFQIAGIPVTLVDVAGVRPLHEAGAVERMGIERALGERARADVVVAVVPVTDDDAHQAVLALGGDIAVLTKSDLARPTAAATPSTVSTESVPPVSAVSAKTGAGLDELRARIGERLRAGAAGVGDDEAVLMRERQVAHVSECAAALDAAVDALRARAVGEVVASELRRAARALDRLLGKDVDADVLDRVFSKFCIGK